MYFTVISKASTNKLINTLKGKSLNKVIDDELLEILEPDDNKWTGLQWAVVNNHPEIVKILYQKQLAIEKKMQKLKKKKKQMNKQFLFN